jgi:purine/pyrimidine-nucleoside phosphorylase
MSQFEQVTVVTKANVYFDGKVTSRTVLFADGTKKTLGIMLPGEYEFGADVKEIMEIQAGELNVLLPGQSDWLQINGTGEFTVPAGTRFKLEVKTVTDYICSYIHE